MTGAMRRGWIALLAAGCTGVDADIEDQITIVQGVYGLLIAGCDESGCVDQPAAGEQVIVFVPGAGDRSVVSDVSGVYQIDLPAGDYTLCTHSCTPVAVPRGTVRYDWVSGPGGGRWQPPGS